MTSDSQMALKPDTASDSNCGSRTTGRKFSKGLCCPGCTQSMQDEAVCDAQVGWVSNEQVCIMNICVLRFTPGLVTDYSITMPTSRIRAVSVAVDQRRFVSSLH